MFRLAVKSVRHNPKRLILTAIAVALGVSLVTASHTFTNSLSSGFSELFSEIYSATDVLVEQDPANADPAGGSPFAPAEGIFDDSVVDDVLAVEGVDAAFGGIQVRGSILPPDYSEQTTDLLDSGGASSQIYNWAGVSDVDQSTIIEGRGPEANGEIVLDIDSAPALGYELGDQVFIAAAGGVSAYELVGTVRFGSSNSLQGANLAFITTEDAFALADAAEFQTISVIIADGSDPATVATRIQELLPEGARAITGEDKAVEQAQLLDEVLGYIDVFAIAFALISLFVGAYIIVNTFRIIVTQRTREFGLMRAIGVTGRQVRTMILLEALVVAIIASTIGIVVGYLLALAASWGVSQFVEDVFGTLTLPLSAVAWSYVLGTLVTLISALMPAITASRISPMEALRESATSGKKPLKVRNIVGTAMGLSGVITIAIGLFTGVQRPYIYVGVGAVLLVLGATLLAAQVLVPMAYGLRSLLTRMFGVDGKLAANNIRREPRRSANTAAALMIGVMLLALVATFTESLKTVVTAQLGQAKADFFAISAQGPIPPGALEVIQGVDGVELVTGIAGDAVSYQDTTHVIAVVDAANLERAFDYNAEPPLTEINGGVYIGPTVVSAGVEVGDEVTLEARGNTITLEVTGQYKLGGDASFILDQAQGEELLGTADMFQGLVVLEDGEDATEAQAVIQDALAENYPLVFLQSPSELEQFANQFIDLLLGIISALLASALVIAVLGVANTLLLSVTERTREIGLLRAVGLKRSSVWRMITVESMVMAVFGTILGMILGVSLGSALVLALEDFGFQDPTIPWMWLVIYTVLAAIAGVVAALWPAWRASRLDILKAIAADG